MLSLLLSGAVRLPLFHLWLGIVLGILTLNNLGIGLLIGGALLVLVSKSPAIIVSGFVLSLVRGLDTSSAKLLTFSFLDPLRESIAEFMMVDSPPLQSALRLALVLGDGGSIPSFVWRDFRELGLAHLLVISGSHIAILALICFGVARRLIYISRHIVLCRALVSLVILAFAAICAGGVPVLRAAVSFFLVWCLGFCFPALHRYTPIDRLSLVGAVFALLWPADVVSASYVLSFGATLSLLWLKEMNASPFEYWIFPTLYVGPLCHLFGIKVGALAPIANAIGIPLFEFVIAPLSLVGMLWRPLEVPVEDCLRTILGWLSSWSLFSSSFSSSHHLSLEVSGGVVFLCTAFLLKLPSSRRSRLLLWTLLSVYHYMKVDFDF